MKKKGGGWSRTFKNPSPNSPFPHPPGLEERKRKGCTDLRAEEDFKSECL